MRKFLFLNFRAAAAVKHWFLSRFTPAGRLVFSAMVLCAFFGINTGMNMAYQGFTFLAALVLVAFWGSLVFPSPLSVRRFAPRFGTVGVRLSYRMAVTNRRRKKAAGLFLSERMTDPRPGFSEFSASREPLQDRRNLFDRFVGYHRWMWLVALNRRAEPETAPVPDVGPGGTAEVTISLTPRRRGRLDLPGVTVSRPDPLGLYRALRTEKETGSILVLPRRYRLPPVDLPGRRRHQPGGVALASSVGDAEEFISLRDYRPGDPIRQIHWRSWAKAGKPIVKEFQEEYFVRHALILDTFWPVKGDERFEEAVSVAASFVAAVDTRESLLDLLFVGTEAYCFTGGRGLAHEDRMLEILASAEVCPDRPFSTLSALARQRAPQLSGCILVLLGWDEPRRELVRTLQGHLLPMLVVAVVGEGEAADLDPGPMKTRPANFVPLEVGRIEEGLESWRRRTSNH
jgi:uncharacterized protein (DUF58 family)